MQEGGEGGAGGCLGISATQLWALSCQSSATATATNTTASAGCNKFSPIFSEWMRKNEREETFEEVDF